MVDISNFIVRKSGKKEDKFYIDYMGMYKLFDFSKITAIEQIDLKEIFISNQASYDEELEIYYFDSAEEAKEAIQDILAKIKTGFKEKIVHLSEAEIEIIRKALINDGSNLISKDSKLKDSIFKKLNY